MVKSRNLMPDRPCHSVDSGIGLADPIGRGARHQTHLPHPIGVPAPFHRFALAILGSSEVYSTTSPVIAFPAASVARGVPVLRRVVR